MPLGDDLQDSTISKSMYTIPVSWALIRRALYTYKPTYKRQGVQKHAKKCNVVAEATMAAPLERVVVSSSDKWYAALVLAASPMGVAMCCGCFPVCCAVGDLQFLKDFIAGGTSGCIAKCATAPLESSKLAAQLLSGPTGLRLAASLASSESGPVPSASPGWINPWAGNGVNCLRYFPTQACNFAFKDPIKSLLPKADKRTEFGKFFAINMLSGGLAGAASLLFVYPLDFARTMLAIDAHGTRRLHLQLLPSPFLCT